MASGRTTATHRFEVQPFTHRPVAEITPSEATQILGSSVLLSATGSTVDGKYSTDFEFAWELTAPDGSVITDVTLDEEDGSKVKIDADVTGTYVVTLTVTYEGVDSEPVSAGVFFSPVIVPAIKRVVPDGQFMFSVLSSFWRMVNDRNAFPVIWSSFTQSVASDFLRALQIDRAKSIRTIQPLFQKRFINISPAMEIDHTQVDILLGNHQSGSGAFTGQVSFVGTGAIVSSTEFLLLNAANDQAVGTDLEIYTGDNAGVYRINRLNSSGNGFIVSEATFFPSPSSVERVSGIDLVGSGADILYSVSGDFVAGGVVAGDYLHIKEGRYAGYYRILEVGTADGLSTDRHIRIDSDVGVTSNLKFRTLKKIRATYLQREEAFTDVVYIPKDEADLDSYDVADLSSVSGELVSDYEILVSPRHVVDSAIDKKIQITTGTIGGTSFTISGFNASRTGFIVTEPFSVSSYPESVSYKIKVQTSASDRLLILEGKGHDIANIALLSDLPTLEEGGRGDLWAITLADKSAPSRVEGGNWRIGSTITYDAIENFSNYGVTRGDLLVLEISRTDLQKSSYLYCTVTGTRNNQVSFELGTSEIVSGQVGSADPENILQISADLSIPSVTVSESTGEAVFTSSALEVYSFLSGTRFSSNYYGIPLDAETLLNIDDFFSVRVKPVKIIRNSSVALDPEQEREDAPIFSIPSLVEYLSPEQVATNDGDTILVAKDMSVVPLDREPIKLVENINYKISKNSLFGAGASTSANSATIVFSDLNTVKNDIRVGDTIELTSGLSMGTYSVSGVPTPSTIRVGGREVDGRLPVSTQSSVSYTITRQTEREFVRFTPGTFSADNPAPETLWAPVVLEDNFKYIEDNFGLMVNLTKEEMGKYGTSQISYLSAVTGLMYSWASGPTFKSCEIGAHILLDVPVSEELGEIVEINDSYLETSGRILIEDITPEGEGTGIYRSYLYPNNVEFNLEKFKGLGINPQTGAEFAVGDVVDPFTPLSNSVVISDNVSNPGWWGAYSNVAGEVELQKYHTWQVEVDLLTVDSRDMPLVSDFLMKIRPIYTKPKIVGVLALQDTVYVEDDLYIDIDMFLYDDTAFSRESAHMVDSYNGSSLSTRLLDFGSYSTRTLFRGDDLSVDAEDDPTLVTSTRGGFVSGVLNDAGEQTLPYINSYFQEEVLIRGSQFVQEGDVLYITTGVNRGRFIVDEVVSDTELRISQYLDSAPRGLDPATHMRSDSDATFHIQRYEDSLVDRADGISSVGGTPDGLGTDNIIVVDGATFWSNGVTADDVLIISTGDNRGVYHIENVGEYHTVPEIFENEETTLTLREPLPNTGDLSHPFEIRRRALLENPTFSATDGVTSAGLTYIETASNPDLALIEKGDILTPTSGSDEGVSFRVIGVSGNSIHVDLPFSGAAPEFTVTHLTFQQDESDSDYRFERLHPKDELEVTVYRPVIEIHSGTFTLSDNGDVLDLICTATDEGATDLTALATPVQVGDLLEVEVAAADNLDETRNPAVPGTDGVLDTTTSSSHGVYQITAVSGSIVEVAEFFPGVVLSLASLLDPSDPEYSAAVISETGVAAKIYTPQENFNVSGATISLTVLPTDYTGATMTLAEVGVVPGDIFEDSYGTEHLIIEVAGSVLTLAESTGLTETMSGRIFRRAATFQREFPDETS